MSAHDPAPTPSPAVVPTSVPFSRIHDLMRRVHDSSDLIETLDAITDGVTELVGFGIAVACLTRADGTLEVVSVSASEDIRRKLLGQTTPMWDLARDDDYAEHWGLFRYVAREHFRPWQRRPQLPALDRPGNPDAWHPYDSLYAPLLGSRSEVIGMLQVDLPPGQVKPTETTRDLLDFFAIQAGMAIRQDQEQERLAEEIRLSEVAQSMMLDAVEGKNLDDVLSASAQTMRNGFEADLVAVRLTGDEYGPLGAAWVAGDDTRLPVTDDVQVELRALAELAWREQRVVVLSPDKALSDPYPGVDLRLLVGSEVGRRTVSTMLAPVGAGGELFGHIVLLRWRGRQPWSEAETRAVHLIARNLGTAVLNARLLERERAYAEDLRSVDAYKRSFFAAVSHEFKGPLTAISGHAELLQDREDLDLIDVSIDSIARNSARLTEMVEDLMVLQQVEDADRVPAQEAVDLGAAAAEAIDVWRMHARQHDVTILLDKPAEPVLALGQRTELGRVTANLVSNAVKYSHVGGQVHLAVGVSGDQVWFSCTDDGLGMSEQDQEQLFLQFFRGSDPAVHRIPGTGLGLSIVKRIVDQHSGTLDVSSEPGKGSTFTVTLPRA